MSKETILDNGHVGLWYHMYKGIIHVQVKSPDLGPAYRECLEVGAKHLKRRNAIK